VVAPAITALNKTTLTQDWNLQEMKRFLPEVSEGKQKA
jgi:hypothetical protein